MGTNVAAGLSALGIVHIYPSTGEIPVSTITNTHSSDAALLPRWYCDQCKKKNL